jgi:hypothetical protein
MRLSNIALAIAALPYGAYPAYQPTLNLDFISNTILDPQITFTRASTATFFNSSGVLTSAAIDAPRFDYDPVTLAPKGLLIEEQRTNSIRNNTMQGAVAGTPGTMPTNWFAATSSNGLTRQIVGVGSENGINYIDVRYSGTTSAANLTAVYPATATEVTALSGQTWTGSFYVSLVGGSTANTVFTVVGIDEVNSGGAFLAGSNTAFTLTSGGLAGKRYTHTRALNNASTAFIVPYVFFTYNSGVAIDITLRIGMPQLERGAFATSVIPTTTAAATRAADIAVMTGTNFSSWYNQSEGTMFAEVGYQQNNPASTQAVASFNDTTANNRWTTAFGTTGSGVMLRNTGGAGLLSTSTSNLATLGATNKIAVAISTGASLVLNGGTVATNASYAAPTVTQLELGRQLTAAYFNGHIRRITYYPRRLSNAQLQSLTS